MGIRDALHSACPDNARIVRIHSSGDFYGPHYFRAWCAFLSDRSDLYGYGYTKSLSTVWEYRKNIPNNMHLTCSVGGLHDSMLDQMRVLGMHSATVVRDTAHAESLSLPLDYADIEAYRHDRDFALLIHGIQPKGGARI